VRDPFDEDDNNQSLVVLFILLIFGMYSCIKTLGSIEMLPSNWNNKGSTFVVYLSDKSSATPQRMEFISFASEK